MAHARTGCPRLRRARWTVALLVATHLLSATGLAQPEPSDAELQRARARFKEGITYIEQARWAEAADTFQEVAAIKASPVVTYNLALAFAKLGKLVQATELLRPLERDMSAPEEVRRSAAHLLAEVEPRLGSVTVRATGDTTDLELWVGARELTASFLGRPIEVNPGSVEVRAVRGGQQLARKWIEVSEGSRNAQVMLELGEDDRFGVAPVAAVPPPRETANTGYDANETNAASDDAAAMDFAEDRNDSGSVFKKWWFWTIVGVVAAGGVTAAILLTGDDTEAAPVGGDIGDGVIRSSVVVMEGM